MSPTAHTGGSGARPGRRDLVTALALAGLCLAAFGSNLGGGFVYDDQRQIVDNHLIQEPHRLGRALASDVWAFKGEREQAWSNYWRPTFVLWLALNYQLFGLQPLGWHVANLLLHAVVCVLGYRLLLRLGVSWAGAAAAAALFAVHPVHTESVAWVSGAPDLLAAAGVVSALLLALPPGGASPRRLAGALLSGALAMLAKEVAVVLPVLVALGVATAAGGEGADRKGRARRALLAALPFAAVAVLFLLARLLVLGQVEISTPWRLSPVELLLTLPSVFLFYLRQLLLPLRLGPSYPLRAVDAASAGLAILWLPLLLCGLTAAGAALAARRSPRAAFGVALFALPLLPALNLNAFIQEQLVHDRYLYLPLLGALLVLVEAAASARSRPPETAVLGAALLLCLPLCALSASYARAWGSEVALWERGVEVDPGSAFNRAMLGHALLAAGQREQALVELNRAIAIRPVTSALLTRAELLTAAGRFGPAERDLQAVLAALPDNSLAWERLAIARQGRGDLEGAAAALRSGRERAPHRACGLSANLAVVLYLEGRKGEALAELEATRAAALAGEEGTVACRLALFHLGSLYAELGRREEAAETLGEYLAVSARDRDPRSSSSRERASRTLAAMKAGR